MRVLVAGATSVPGLPLLRELNARGYDIVGLTSQPAKTSQIEQEGAKPVVADVFDAVQINKVVADIEPEVVVSLLGRTLCGNGFRRHLAAAVERQGEGRAGLDPYSPMKFGARFSKVAVMPSVRSFDGSIAAFHAAT